MSGSALTCNGVARLQLLDLGVTSFDPANPTVQSTQITSSDLYYCAYAQTAAYQEIYSDETGEPKNQPGSTLLNAPTTVTLNVTQNSKTISSLTTFASWMIGCTIRITGDSQDNEIISSTLLARPFTGSTGSGISAQVFGDCIALDDTIGRIISPMFLPSGNEVCEVTDRRQFVVNGGYPVANWGIYPGVWWYRPFWSFAQKPVGNPLVFFIDGQADPTLDYVPRRLRVSPMPMTAQVLSYSVQINPPRVATADIDNVGHTDPGVKIAVPNGWVESMFVPIARYWNMSNPRFHNDQIKGVILDQYEKAKRRLKDSDGSAATVKTTYW